MLKKAVSGILIAVLTIDFWRLTYPLWVNR